MSRNRFTLEDVSKKPKWVQDQVAEAMAVKAREVQIRENAAKDKILIAAACGAGVIPSESYQQQDLIVWWRVACVAHGLDERVLMGFPLQGARTKANASRLKAEGMRAGTPDLLLAVRRGAVGGLWIEMKTHRRGSKPSESQKEMLEILSRDYLTIVCRSTAEAQAAITTYLTR